MPCAPPAPTPPRSSAPEGEKVVPPLWAAGATGRTAVEPRPEERASPPSLPLQGAQGGDYVRQGSSPGGDGAWGRGARVAGIPARGEKAPGHCEAAARLRGGAGTGGGGRVGVVGGGGGRGTGLRFSGRKGAPLTRNRGGPRTRGGCGGVASFWLSERTSRTVMWGQCVCPPRKIACFEDAKPLQLRIVSPAKRRTPAREAFSREGRRDAGKSQDGGGDRGAADTEPLWLGGHSKRLLRVHVAAFSRRR